MSEKMESHLLEADTDLELETLIKIAILQGIARRNLVLPTTTENIKRRSYEQTRKADGIG